jgi:hypothetical protein
MTISLSQLLEDSLQIAWEYLKQTGELGDGAKARILELFAHLRFDLTSGSRQICFDRSWLILSPERNVTRELLFFVFRNNVEDPLWKIESKVT